MVRIPVFPRSFLDAPRTYAASASQMTTLRFATPTGFNESPCAVRRKLSQTRPEPSVAHDQLADACPQAIDFPWDMIGEGGQGFIFRSCNKQSGTPGATKLYHKRPSVSEDVANELKVYEHLGHHPNLLTSEVTFHGPLTMDKDLRKLINAEYACCMPLMKSDLIDWLKDGLAGKRGDAYYVITSLIGGVRYMHKKFVAHHDLKPENVMLDPRGVVKVIDFGFAEIYETFPVECSKRCGSYSYAAFEVHSKGRYDPFAADMFSIGCILFSLYTGMSATPLNVRMIAALKKAGPTASFTDVFEELYAMSLTHRFESAPQIRRLIDNLLLRAPIRRLSAGQAHDYLIKNGSA